MAEGRNDKGQFTAKNTIQMLRQSYSDGRPRVFDAPLDFYNKALEYFEWADQVYKGKYAYADFKLYCGFLSRQSLKRYRDNPLFSDAFYIVDLLMEGDAEKRLNWAGSFNGAKFKLMNKHGWKEEVNQNITGTITAKYGSEPIHTPSKSDKDTSSDK